MAKTFEFMIVEASDSDLTGRNQDGVVISTTKGTALEESLNGVGSDGWDLHSTLTLANGAHVLIMRRQGSKGGRVI